MKHSRTLPTASDALKHVFLQPLTPRALRPLHPLPTLPQRRHQSEEQRFAIYRPRYSSSKLQAHEEPAPSTQPPIRRPFNPHTTSIESFGPRSSTPTPLRNEQLPRIIRLVLPTGSLSPPTPLSSILATVNTRTHFLQQVSPPNSAQIPIPVCKIIGKVEAKTKEKERAKQQRASLTGTKRLEIAWGIARHDLEHKLAKMAEICAEGKRVEVLLGGARRKGWQKKKVGGEEELEGIVRTVRERIRGMEGGREWKEMEGELGDVLTLFVEGKGERGKKEKRGKEAEGEG
ncbi:hypothetical protein MMC30_006176 [Trapelia coarctata]|nr:hypothetical protein [Trapelia coarctata]